MLKYIKLTFEYLTLKKWLVYAILAIIPAISFIALTSEFSLTYILLNMDKLNFETFKDIINVLFGKMDIIIFIILIIVDSVLLSFILGTIDRDMRLGDFKLQHFSIRVNFHFLTCILFLSLIAVAFFINKIIITSIILLFIKLEINKALLIILILATSVFFFFVLMVFFTMFFISPPLIISGGRRFFYSLSESILYTKDRIFKIFNSILIPAIVKAIIIQAFSLIGKNITLVVECIVNIFLTVYMIVLMFVIYYDALDLERVDKNKLIKW